MSASSSSELVRVEVGDAVAVISLCRPDRHNAFTDKLEATLAAAVDHAIADNQVRVLLLRGDGRSFSSGRDISELGARPEGVTNLDFIAGFQQSRLRMYSSPKPVVVALKGAVMGMGLEIALCADFRVASDDARLAFPEVNYGIMTDTGGIPFAAALAGPSRVKYLVMTGEKIDAAQALAWGLVDFVVEPEKLDARASELARQLASKSPLVLAMAKKTVDALWAESVRAGMREELLAQCVLFNSEDHAAAKRALRNNTAPRHLSR